MVAKIGTFGASVKVAAAQMCASQTGAEAVSGALHAIKQGCMHRKQIGVSGRIRFDGRRGLVTFVPVLCQSRFAFPIVSAVSCATH